MEHERVSLGEPGHFYVERHCCLSCRAPELEAPELMAFDEQEGTCYFRRQPSTPQELDNAISAVRASCIAAVRYGGHDLEVLRRLAACGSANSADYTAP